MIRAVFFDAVGTLIHPDPSPAVVYAQIGKRFGSQLPDEEVRKRFSRHFREEDALDREADWRTSEERELRRWRSIVSQTLDDVADPEGCFQALYRHFGEASSWRVDEDADKVIDLLQKRGLPVGMASNYDHRLHRIVAGRPELLKLDRIVISSEVGQRKPGRLFFDAVCRSVECAPHEILFVGDDLPNDLEGAQAAGMPAILIGNGVSLTAALDQMH